MTVNYDPFSDAALDNPTAIYRELRDEEHCYFIIGRNSRAISRFQDLWDADLDTRHFTAAHGTMTWDVMRGSRNVAVMLHQMDPPQHNKLQRAVFPWFGKEALAKHRAQVEGLAIALVDNATERGQFDIVHDIAWRLAAQVTALACGLPLEDANLIKDLTTKSTERVPEVEGKPRKAPRLPPTHRWLFPHLLRRFASTTQRKCSAALLPKKPSFTANTSSPAKMSYSYALARDATRENSTSPKSSTSTETLTERFRSALGPTRVPGVATGHFKPNSSPVFFS